jgi:hypothetical protein
VTAEGEKVTRSRLPEISLIDQPAQDGTACWLVDKVPADLSPDVGAARARWQARLMTKALSRPAA